LVVYYLCLNRFENLAATGYFFALQHRVGLQQRLAGEKVSRESIGRVIKELDSHLLSIRAIYLDKNAVPLPSDEEITVFWQNVLGRSAIHGL
jgi:hypothetical protein